MSHNHLCPACRNVLLERIEGYNPPLYNCPACGGTYIAKANPPEEPQIPIEKPIPMSEGIQTKRQFDGLIYRFIGKSYNTKAGAIKRAGFYWAGGHKVRVVPFTDDGGKVVSYWVYVRDKHASRNPGGDPAYAQTRLSLAHENLKESKELIETAMRQIEMNLTTNPPQSKDGDNDFCQRCGGSIRGPGLCEVCEEERKADEAFEREPNPGVDTVLNGILKDASPTEREYLLEDIKSWLQKQTGWKVYARNGGSFDYRVVAGNTIEEIKKTWDVLVDQSLREDGHSYSGAIGMLGHGFEMVNRTFKSEVEAADWLAANHEKWGRAKAVAIDKGGPKKVLVIGGWCSS